MKLRIAILAVVLAAGSACGKEENPVPYPTVENSAPVNLGICFDGYFTEELRPEIVQQSKDGIADALDAWVAQSEHPELNIAIRKADEGAMHPDALIVDETIPAVQPLPAKPDIEDPKYDEKNGDWVKANREHSRSNRNGKTVAGRLGDKLRARNTLVESNSSNITGCLSAMTQDFDGGPNVIVLVSDLHGDGQRELYSLDGVKVLIVHTCSIASHCKEHHAEWSPRLEGAGAEVEIITNPNLLSDKLIDLLKES